MDEKQNVLKYDQLKNINIKSVQLLLYNVLLGMYAISNHIMVISNLINYNTLYFRSS